MTVTAANTGFWRWLVRNPWARRICYFPILPTLVIAASHLLLDWPDVTVLLVGAALSAGCLGNRYLDWRSLRRTGHLFLVREPSPGGDGPAS
ncbi:hypothetical protein [Crossiella sp. NPDC003009]